VIRNQNLEHLEPIKHSSFKNRVINHEIQIMKTKNFVSRYVLSYMSCWYN